MENSERDGNTRPPNLPLEKSVCRFSSVTQLFLILCHPTGVARPPCQSPTPDLPIRMSIVSVIPSNHLILCRPLFFQPSIFPSIKVFSNESAFRMRWPKYWSLSPNISPSNEHPGLISFRMDWLDLLAVQGISRVLSNITVQKHQFFGIQLSL